MRGARLSTESLSIPMGIIPADAGSTWMIGPSGLSTTGSSPRMRGAQSKIKGYGPEKGIIPADAGSTQDAQAGARQDQDHPRGCGEHRTMNVPIMEERGSSPRMRGALL